MKNNIRLYNVKLYIYIKYTFYIELALPRWVRCKVKHTIWWWQWQKDIYISIRPSICLTIHSFIHQTWSNIHFSLCCMSTLSLWKPDLANIVKLEEVFSPQFKRHVKFANSLGKFWYMNQFIALKFERWLKRQLKLEKQYTHCDFLKKSTSLFYKWVVLSRKMWHW